MAAPASGPGQLTPDRIDKKLQDRRLNLIIPFSTYSEINDLSHQTRRSISELVRLGLALVRIAFQEVNEGNKLVIKKPSGEEKEIVIPR